MPLGSNEGSFSSLITHYIKDICVKKINDLVVFEKVLDDGYCGPETGMFVSSICILYSLC